MDSFAGNTYINIVATNIPILDTPVFVKPIKTVLNMTITHSM
ncbi:hypothetical protein [Neobacillus niacini]